VTVRLADLEHWSEEPPELAQEAAAIRDHIRDVLDRLFSEYRPFEVYLQGSVANRTAVAAQSDIDVVVQWRGRAAEGSLINNPEAARFDRFASDLQESLGSVSARTRIPQRLARAIRCRVGEHDVDVLPCMSYGDLDGDDIVFWQSGMADAAGEGAFRPRAIAKAVERRDVDTNGHFRHVVRALKGMREAPAIQVGPSSYVIESLVYAGGRELLIGRQNIATRCSAALDGAWGLLLDDRDGWSIRDPAGAVTLFGTDNVKPDNYNDAVAFVERARDELPLDERGRLLANWR
jgi:predicted nucleotidyltransferase